MSGQCAFRPERNIWISGRACFSKECHKIKTAAGDGFTSKRLARKSSTARRTRRVFGDVIHGSPTARRWPSPTARRWPSRSREGLARHAHVEKNAGRAGPVGIRRYLGRAPCTEGLRPPGLRLRTPSEALTVAYPLERAQNPAPSPVAPSPTRFPTWAALGEDLCAVCAKRVQLEA
jgi:hypothetical protein